MNMEAMGMEKLNQIVSAVDSFVWGPVMLVLLVGTGIFLTIRTRFLPWRNLGYAIKSTLSKEARTKNRGTGDVSPFSALTTALAATIGTGNIVGVATAMVSGGPGALVWMWISALFGITSKFSECMLAIKYREVNAKGEISGGPMYTMKKALKHKRFGSVLGWLFAFFAVVASFGIGNISNVPEGLREIFTMAFSMKSVSGGVLGTVVASMTNAMRFGVARGCFSNEAGMGSAAITAAAATTDNPVRQGYINMTGTFWDTIVVCTITGLVIASSGVIGKTSTMTEGSYAITSEAEDTLALTHEEKGKMVTTEYTVTYKDGTLTLSGGAEDIVLTPYADASDSEAFAKLQHQPDSLEAVYENGAITGAWTSGCNAYIFDEDGTYYYEEAYTGSALTIKAFETVLGKAGAWLVTIGIALFAFSTILGWEYHGEKAFEYLFHSHKYNMIYRIVFSLVVYIGATTSLDLAWNFSDIANALMAIPNLICLLLLSKEIATDMQEFQKVLAEEKAAKKRA